MAGAVTYLCDRGTCTEEVVTFALERPNKKGQCRSKLRAGTLFLVYMVAYSSGRIWIEALRTDSLMLGPLPIAQFVSLAGILLGLMGLGWLYLLKRPLLDVLPSEFKEIN